MKIGKLDPRSLFDKGQERQTAVVQEKEMYNNVVIGKLNTKNIFENDQVREVEKQTVQVGRINNKVRRWRRVFRSYSILTWLHISRKCSKKMRMIHTWPSRVLLLEN